MDNCPYLSLANTLIAALAGILGVAVGGWVTAHNQRKERAHSYVRKQLEGFYSPLLGIRALILAKSETGLKISGAAGGAWQRLMEGGSPEVTRRLSEERSPDFQKIIDENNRQLVEELIPLYRRMVQIFSSNLWLAEPATRAHLGVLVEFVEIWDRWLKRTLPAEVVRELGHTEDKLKPFYADLVHQLEALRSRLQA